MSTETQQLNNAERLERARGHALVAPRVAARILAYVLEKNDLDRKAIAKLLGVDPSFISKVVHGHRNLTLAHIEVLSRELNLPVAVLMWKALRPDIQEKQGIFDAIDSLMQAVFPEHREEGTTVGREQMTLT